MVSKKTARKTAPKKDAPRNYVRATAKVLELANVRSAIDFRVFQQSRVLGRVKVGRGSIWWIPRGWTVKKAKKVPWPVFAQMMREWPFGAEHRVRLQLKNGAVYWRARAKGPLRRMSWREFIHRMEMPLPKTAKAKRRAPRRGKS